MKGGGVLDWIIQSLLHVAVSHYRFGRKQRLNWVILLIEWFQFGCAQCRWFCFRFDFCIPGHTVILMNFGFHLVTDTCIWKEIETIYLYHWTVTGYKVTTLLAQALTSCIIFFTFIILHITGNFQQFTLLGNCARGLDQSQGHSHLQERWQKLSCKLSTDFPDMYSL